MHIITVCSLCEKDFMYHASDTHLFIETKENEEIRKLFPIQDETWNSRRWNTDRSDYCDLSGEYDVICQDCFSLKTN